VVRDGREALDYLFREGIHAIRPSNRRPQLILLDLGLPKISGLDVLRRIKGDSRTASIPVIVLTASSRDRDLQMSKQLGALAYIVKPVGLPNLAQVTPQLSFRWALLRGAPTVSA
jgi:CheY-like chemotaxis protein